MRIGYPCSNLALRESASRTFRLVSFSEARLVEAIDANLDVLQRYLTWNAEHGILFFRISSGTIPFASHEVMTFDWQAMVRERLAEIGQFIQRHGIRINMHPGQYTLLNSPKDDVVTRSVAELAYHAEVLDLLGLDATHKIQVHVGGVYGDKDSATTRFIAAVEALPETIRRRLAIENDERQYNLADALVIHRETGIPVLWDAFHHRLFNQGETWGEAYSLAAATWNGHGAPMMDYSSQHPDRQQGAHTESIDLEDFAELLDAISSDETDIMLEIKDKENSALRALELIAARV